MGDFIFEERFYQREAVEKVLQYFSLGKDSILLESPVGSGKTIMGLMIIRALQEQSANKLKVNWVASRRHILTQTEILNNAFFNCDINLVSVFASNPPKADLIVLDEAHHEATQSCINMYEKSCNAMTLGLSATPLRTDRMRLSFQTSVRCCGIPKMIQLGILSEYHAYMLPEWSVDLLAKVFCEKQTHWGKSLVFFSTINECIIFKMILAENNISCEVVTGKSNKDSQLDAFINGDVSVIANVSVLTEGFDLPEIQSVFIRDASRLPTIQMAGRGLRKSPNKTHCNFIQGAKTKFNVEKIALPTESFRYVKNQWLSCSGNTEIISNTIIKSTELLENRKSSMPLYLKNGRNVKEVSLKNISLKTTGE